MGALLLLFVPKENKDAVRWIANYFCARRISDLDAAGSDVLGTTLRAGLQVHGGHATTGFLRSARDICWASTASRFLLIMLTTLLGWISILSSWTANRESREGILRLVFVLQTGMLGVFMALDFFLFFVFWEAMLVPMYLLIGIWGGPRKLYAAIKFFLYTLAGSVLMLLGILFLYFHHHSVTGVYTFALPTLYETAPKIYADYGPQRTLLFLPSSSPSPSRSRCSRSTRGCPTRTSRRLPRVR